MSEDDRVIEQQSEAYRRGQVLGFTMAEIMLVLLFLLLILLGDQLSRLAEDLEVSIQPGTPEHSAIILIQETLDNLKRQGQLDAEDDELWLTEKLTLRAADTVSEIGIDEDARETIERLTLERDLLREQATELAEEAQRLNELLENDPEQAQRQRDANQLLGAVENNQLPLKRALQCMDDCGGGDGKEACWGESIFNPDYIYTVALYDDYIWVQPDEGSTSKHKPDWDAIPNQARIATPQYLSNTEYRRRFSALQRYAIAKNKGPKGCVFHVRLFDLGTTSKESYKSQEQMVESYTYRTEIKDNGRWVGELPPPLPSDPSNDSIDPSPTGTPGIISGSAESTTGKAGSAVAAAAAAVKEQEATSVETPARVLRQASPKYPSRAERRGTQGYCVVSFDVNAQGKVINVAAIPEQCSPRGVFDKASEEAMRKYVYRPRYVDGKAVSTFGLQQRFAYRTD